MNPPCRVPGSPPRWRLLLAWIFPFFAATPTPALDVLAPTFEGRAFSVIEGRPAIDQGRTSAGIAGDRWRWLGVTPDGYGVQLVEDRGGAPEATTLLGPVYGTPGTILGPNTGKGILGPLARDPQQSLDSPELVFVAGQLRNGLYHWDGTQTTTWLEPYAPFPGIADTIVGDISNVAFAQGKVALCADFTGSGAAEGRLTGIYRVPRGGPLQVVADSTMAMPGRGKGATFDRSFLAFDGRTLVFDARYGADRVWYIQVNENAPVEAFAPASTVLPNGASLRVIDEVCVGLGRVLVTAEDSAGIGYLLRWQNGTWTILIREGDRTVEGHQVTGLGQSRGPYTRSPVGGGLVLDEGRVYFGGTIAGKTAIASLDLESGAIHEAIPPGTHFPHEPVATDYEPLRLTVLQARGALLVASVEYAPNKFNIAEREFHWVATLPRPAKPAIWDWPTNVTVAAGATVEWEAKVVGDAPRTYLLNGPRGLVAPIAEGRWRLDAVHGADSGDYQLTVTNVAGLARAPILRLTVPAPPRLIQSPTPQSLRLGERLELQAQVEGGADLVCDWYRNGESIRSFEFSNPQLTLVRPAMNLAEVGWYTLVAHNPYGSVTSAPVRVSMTSEPATASWANRPIIAAILNGEPTQPFGTLVRAYPTGTECGRWQGESLWWSADSSGGLYQVVGRQVTLAVGPGLELPGGLGDLNWLQLVESGNESDPISLLASPNRSSIATGLYRLAGLRLTPWLDTTTPPPPAGDGTPDTWVQWHDAYQNGERFVLTATTTTQGTGLFLVEKGQAKRLLDLSRPALPEVAGPWPIIPSTPAFDGHTAAVVVGGPPTFPSPRGILISVALEGSSVKRLASGDPLPGTTNHVSALGRPVIRAGTIYLDVRDDTLRTQTHILAWEDNQARHVAGPGTPIRGGGALARVLGMRVESGGSKVLVNAKYERNGTLMDGLFLVRDDGVEGVVWGNEFGVWTLGDFWVTDFAGDRLAFMVGSGSPGLFVNTSTPGDLTTTMTVRRGVSGSVRLEAQPQALLEWAPTALGPWSILSAHRATWDLPANEAQGFFRPRRP